MCGDLLNLIQSEQMYEENLIYWFNLEKRDTLTPKCELDKGQIAIATAYRYDLQGVFVCT